MTSWSTVGVDRNGEKGNTNTFVRNPTVGLRIGAAVIFDHWACYFKSRDTQIVPRPMKFLLHRSFVPLDSLLAFLGALCPSSVFHLGAAAATAAT